MICRKLHYTNRLGQFWKSMTDWESGIDFLLSIWKRMGRFLVLTYEGERILQDKILV
jgi:hypothetical protein